LATADAQRFKAGGKMITLLLATLFSIHAHAQIGLPAPAPAPSPELPVRVLDQGACWAQQTAEDSWNIASFNDQVSFVLNQTRLQFELEPTLKAKLKELGIPSMAKSNYSVSIHCSSAGHIIIANFKEAEIPLCLYTDYKLENITVYANPLREEGTCRGVGLESLVIKALDSEHAKLLTDILESPPYKDLVLNADLLESINALTVKLQPSWRFKEAQALEKIKADKELMKHIDTVMFSDVWTIVGESMPLLTHEFSGYEN
jgi:hypothetical protein